MQALKFFGLAGLFVFVYTFLCGVYWVGGFGITMTAITMLAVPAVLVGGISLYSWLFTKFRKTEAPAV